MGFNLDSFFEDMYAVLESYGSGFETAHDTLCELQDVIKEGREYAFECGQVEEYE